MDHALPLDDTSPDARAVQRRLYAAMTPAEKLKKMSELTLAANQLSLAGLALRYPNESRAQLLLRLARLRLGDEIVDRVYGPRHGP
jgi:CHASE2 domain-containing sensor protein